jgi:hypothetical protein
MQPRDSFFLSRDSFFWIVTGDRRNDPKEQDMGGLQVQEPQVSGKCSAQQARRMGPSKVS